MIDCGVIIMCILSTRVARGSHGGYPSDSDYWNLCVFGRPMPSQGRDRPLCRYDEVPDYQQKADIESGRTGSGNDRANQREQNVPDAEGRPSSPRVLDCQFYPWEQQDFPLRDCSWCKRNLQDGDEVWELETGGYFYHSNCLILSLLNSGWTVGTSVQGQAPERLVVPLQVADLQQCDNSHARRREQNDAGTQCQPLSPRVSEFRWEDNDGSKKCFKCEFPFKEGDQVTELFPCGHVYHDTCLQCGECYEGLDSKYIKCCDTSHPRY